MDKKNSIKRAKRQSKVLEENLWDCSVCTYRNTAEAFKCLMCDVRKGTSTRKPRINTAIAAQQAALPGSGPAVPGGIPGSSGKRADGKRGPRSSKKRRQNAPRLRNVDRSSAQTREVTVNSVTVVITEYKPKKTANASVSSGSSDLESSDTGPTNATPARP